MKKILLSLVCLTAFSGVFAQSFSLQDTNGVAIDPGSKIYITGDPSDMVITAKVWFKNNAAEAKEVKVKKFIVEVQPNTMNYFCWGVCYGPDTYESPFAQSIQPGAVSDLFYGDYNPQGMPGKSTIMYTFFDSKNTNDSVAVYVEFNAVAQSFALQDTSGVAIDAGSTITITGDPADDILQAKIYVKNKSGYSKDVKVKKTEVTVLGGTSNYFCWGACYDPSTFESPFAQTIEAGAVNEQFYGDYSPLNVAGTSTIRYTFFDAFNPDDSIAVNVAFNASPSSIDEQLAGKVIISNAYPNPAKEVVFVDYKLSGMVNDLSVQVTNMLGSRVKEIQLVELQGTARIGVAELPDGIYFYSLVADGKSVLTRKFVVKH